MVRMCRRADTITTLLIKSAQQTGKLRLSVCQRWANTSLTLVLLCPDIYGVKDVLDQ